MLPWYIEPNESEDLGYSSCNTTVAVSLKQQPLPARVYLVCGDQAYAGCLLPCLSCPYDKISRKEGTGFSTWMVEADERDLHDTETSRTPSYGVYVSQKEVMVLSKVLENHLDASSTAMLSEHKELQEVKAVALQNRMALDLLSGPRRDL